jgi:hypothetical protein
MTGLFGFITNWENMQVAEEFLQLLMNGIKA